MMSPACKKQNGTRGRPRNAWLVAALVLAGVTVAVDKAGANVDTPWLHSDNHPAVTILFGQTPLIFRPGGDGRRERLPRRGSIELTLYLKGTVPGFAYKITVQELKQGSAAVHVTQQQETQSVKDHRALDHPVTLTFEIFDAEQETYRFFIDVSDAYAAYKGLTANEGLLASKDVKVLLHREEHTSVRLEAVAGADERTADYSCSNACDRFGFEKGVVLGAISHVDGWGDVKDPRLEVRVTPFSASQGRSSEALDPKDTIRCLFVGKVECVAPLRCQPVALKVFHREGSYAFYLNEVAQLMEQHGISTPRLARGSAGDKHWTISEWIEYRDGSCSHCTHAAIVDMQEDALRRIGELLATVHRIDAKWFPPVREHVLRNCAGEDDVPWARVWLWSHREYPTLALEDDHEVDAYAYKTNRRFFLAHHGDSSVFRVSVDTSSWTLPKHSIARRLVTSHNDLHLGNVLFSSSEDRFYLVDIDQIGVGPAIHDLAFFILQLGDHLPDYKRAFLAGYLAAMGENWGLETLLVDCELAKLGSLYAPNMHHAQNVSTEPSEPAILLPIRKYNLTEEDVVWRLAFAQEFAAMVRGSSKMQDHIRTKGLSGTMSSLIQGRFQTEGSALMHRLRQILLHSGQGPWYFANLSTVLSELVVSRGIRGANPLEDKVSSRWPDEVFSPSWEEQVQSIAPGLSAAGLA